MAKWVKAIIEQLKFGKSRKQIIFSLKKEP